MENKVYVNTGDTNHTTIKIPDFILLKESRRECKKLQNEIDQLHAKIAKLYNQLNDAYNKITAQDKVIDGFVNNNLPDVKEDLLALKREEHYIRQLNENKVLQQRIHELRTLIEKDIWTKMKSK